MDSQQPGPAVAGPDRVPRGIDISVAHPARRYDYWLGGKDNFPADRESAEAIAAVFPTVRLAAVENRHFLQRAVRYLAGEAGIRQFLDIGTGIPTADNTHEVAQGIAPESRVVYVDNDPIVLAHARALLTSSTEGRTTYLDADLREPETILGHPALRQTLDLSQPVALMMVAILHFFSREDQPHRIAERLLSELAPGSYLVASHGTADLLTQEARAAVPVINAAGRVPYIPRSKAEFARFFDGLEFVPPGIVSVSEWRDDEPPPRPTPEEIAIYGAVGRVPDGRPHHNDES